MTISKCIQLAMYGIIAGYELPRMISRFSPPKFPGTDRKDKVKLNAIYTTPYPELHCEPGNELENSPRLVSDIVEQSHNLSLTHNNG